ncbi:hypothetical protein J3D43_001471 [Paenibacillus xylanexedens]|nr:hypothetical protein [Paenibacillus xylanexedens]
MPPLFAFLRLLLTLKSSQAEEMPSLFRNVDYTADSSGASPSLA